MLQDAEAQGDELKRKFRLPSEAEWGIPSRAGAATAFHFGNDPNDLGDYAWYAGNAGARTHPVGEKKPNNWGLYDMHGNVWQFCQDYFGSQEGLLERDPVQLKNSQLGHVRRGGSFIMLAARCASRVRGNIPLSKDCGFRMAFTPDILAPGEIQGPIPLKSGNR